MIRLKDFNIVFFYVCFVNFLIDWYNVNEEFFGLSSIKIIRVVFVGGKEVVEGFFFKVI